jgi:AmmeMemoRadiSam system protein A
MIEKKAGVFVSLHKKSDHSLRGCIGSFLPTKNNVAEEIISNAISAAFKDPRFLPLTEKELDDLEINVDILSEPGSITDIKQLNPKKYGLLVKNQDNRSGLLLPDIGIETVEEQIAVCCQKGGIDPNNDKLEFYRFTVERHK